MRTMQHCYVTDSVTKETRRTIILVTCSLNSSSRFDSFHNNRTDGEYI